MSTSQILFEAESDLEYESGQDKHLQQQRLQQDVCSHYVLIVLVFQSQSIYNLFSVDVSVYS